VALKFVLIEKCRSVDWFGIRAPDDLTLRVGRYHDRLGAVHDAASTSGSADERESISDSISVFARLRIRNVQWH
jgi:hypothetical protein